jgi:hypothetical protein
MILMNLMRKRRRYKIVSRNYNLLRKFKYKIHQIEVMDLIKELNHFKKMVGDHIANQDLQLLKVFQVIQEIANHLITENDNL